MFCTYVLKSSEDDNLYVGFTSDLRSRIKEHAVGRVSATRDRRPLDLIYYEACQSKVKALERESYFKTGFGRRFLKGRV